MIVIIRKLFWAAMAFVILGLASACAKTPEVRYFANLAGVISPLLEYNPRGEVSADEAKSINHYRVQYDQHGRLKEIAYFQTQYPSNSSYFRTHSVRYNYDDNIRTRVYFDRDGNPSAKWRHYYQSQNVHTEVFTSDGGKTALELFDIEGNQVAVGTGTYRFVAYQIDGRSFLQKHFKEDGDLNTIFPSLLFETVVISTDENGFLYSVVNWDEATQSPINDDRMGYGEMRLNFDQYGNEGGWEYRDVTGELVNDPDDGYAKTHYDFTWYDQELGLYSQYTQKSFDRDGSLYCSSSAVCANVVGRDRAGNIVSRSFLDVNDAVMNNPDAGFAVSKIERTDRGQPSEIIYYDQNGFLREGDVAIRRFAYDDAGGLVGERHFDNQEQEIQRDQ